MKKLANLLMLVLCFFIFSCEDKDPDPICNQVIPPQPSFTQDKYQVHLGESVTFTYDGPAQYIGNNPVSYDWESVIMITNPPFPQEAHGEKVTFTYNSVGAHKVKLSVRNCAGGPFISKEPAVIVIP